MFYRGKGVTVSADNISFIKDVFKFFELGLVVIARWDMLMYLQYGRIIIVWTLSRRIVSAICKFLFHVRAPLIKGC